MSQVANNALKLVEKQAKEIVSLKEEIDKLKNVPSNINQLEERIEERTNRQLRKTLVSGAFLKRQMKRGRTRKIS